MFVVSLAFYDLHYIGVTLSFVFTTSGMNERAISSLQLN